MTPPDHPAPTRVVSLSHPGRRTPQPRPQPGFVSPKNGHRRTDQPTARETTGALSHPVVHSCTSPTSTRPGPSPPRSPPRPGRFVHCTTARCALGCALPDQGGTTGDDGASSVFPPHRGSQDLGDRTRDRTGVRSRFVRPNTGHHRTGRATESAPPQHSRGSAFGRDRTRPNPRGPPNVTGPGRRPLRPEQAPRGRPLRPAAASSAAGLTATPPAGKPRPPKQGGGGPVPRGFAVVRVRAPCFGNRHPVKT